MLSLDWATLMESAAPGLARRALASGVRAAQRHRLHRQARRPWEDQGSTAARALLIGSVSLGGAGKTPVTAFLARLLAARGRQVAIVGHGYGARRGDVRRATGDAALDGDEAVELLRALPGVPVFLAADRRAALNEAARVSDVVLLDSGLGSRDLPGLPTILLEDATCRPGVFPAGYGRFHPDDVPGVVLRWTHKVDEPGARRGDADVESRFLATSLRAPSGEDLPLDTLQTGEWISLCGIGRPGSFQNSLAVLGARIREHRTVGDHRRVPERLSGLTDGARGVTTGKDAARMPAGHGFHVLEGRVDIVRGADLLDATLQTMGL